MSAQQKMPQFQSGPLRAGAILVGIGAAIGLIGLGVSGGHVIAATRRWIDELETPPSELARQRWVQGKAAVAAGASAWQNHPKQSLGQNQNGSAPASVNG
ncbi:MAG TPA: hypothetical protein VGG75_18335 [Trebonia sp.]